MKKLIGIVLMIVLILTLSGCQNDVEIFEDVVNVEILDTSWEDDTIVTDVYITNGMAEAVYINYLEIVLYLPDGVTQFAAAGYDIMATVDSNSYNKYRIEFTSEFIRIPKSQFEALNVSLDDLELMFVYN